MNFQRSKKNGLGLDLGHHRIKMVELESTASGWKVVAHASTPTPSDSIRDGVVVDSEAVSEAIKRLLKDGKFSGGKVALAASGGAVFVRLVNFPKVAESTLRKTIRFEAGRYVPGSVEESHIDFTIVGDAPDNQMSVIMVAAPKDIVNSRVKAAQAAGLEVDAVDVEAFALFRTLQETVPTDEPLPTTAIVDIGSASTSVSVIHEKVFSMNRTIPYGGVTLTEALRTYFKLSVEDAEAGKSQLDLRDLMSNDAPSENPPLRVIQPHVDDLVREIRRSLNYFQSQNTDGKGPRKVEAIVLSGGGAKLVGIDVYFAHRLGLPVTLTSIYTHPLILSEKPQGVGGLDLAVAGGLAMRTGFKAA